MKTKQPVKKRRDDVERAPVNIRNVAKRDWENIKDIAKQEGLSLWMVLDEMFHDWLKKHRH
jgi:hypothetical protein